MTVKKKRGPEDMDTPRRWPNTEAEMLHDINDALAWPSMADDMGDGYGRCVYAMSRAATAAFNYVAGKLGVSGFQASCANMDFLADSRGYGHGMMVIDANDLLYPQYNTTERVAEWITKTRVALAPAARELIAKGVAHPDVMRHLQEIAALDTEASA